MICRMLGIRQIFDAAPNDVKGDHRKKPADVKQTSDEVKPTIRRKKHFPRAIYVDDASWEAWRSDRDQSFKHGRAVVGD